MNKYKFGQLIASVLFLTLLFGCSIKAESKAFDGALTAAEAALTNEKIKPNNDLQNLSLYIPSHISISEETNSNLILKNEDQTIILFYNPLEFATSKLNYEEASSDEDYLMLESFESKEKFGYIKISSGKKHTYELQIGAGSVKVTTLTTKSKLEEDAATMMKIANSIEYK
ncbi:hypothetical protein [Sediminibacillus albus]|uniref:Lipoprotein n=1 Tax=Sediminibacillus albus TaxID=407036 RepID=A0A1G9BYT3_9BACI|nr:hypothetical protein [Sediminibacillus albus]SDK44324.1 hypothetical protein SAMN05216243_3197 [Sediminibacillus albus]